LLLESAAGHKIRSRCSHDALDESGFLFHANQEYKNAKRNSLPKLKVEN